MLDPFFRSVLAVHDLTDLTQPRLGLALRNPAYHTATRRAAPSGVVTLELGRQQVGKRREEGHGRRANGKVQLGPLPAPASRPFSSFSA